MHNQEGLEELARDFLSSVDEATFLLEEKFGTRCILRLWRRGEIKRCGGSEGKRNLRTSRSGIRRKPIICTR